MHNLSVTASAVAKRIRSYSGFRILKRGKATRTGSGSRLVSMMVHACPASEYSTTSSLTRTLPWDNESPKHVYPDRPSVLRMSAAIPTKPSRNSEIRSRGHGRQATDSAWQQKENPARGIAEARATHPI